MYFPKKPFAHPTVKPFHSHPFDSSHLTSAVIWADDRCSHSCSPSLRLRATSPTSVRSITVKTKCLLLRNGCSEPPVRVPHGVPLANGSSSSSSSDTVSLLCVCLPRAFCYSGPVSKTVQNGAQHLSPLVKGQRGAIPPLSPLHRVQQRVCIGSPFPRGGLLASLRAPALSPVCYCSPVRSVGRSIGSSSVPRVYVCVCVRIISPRVSVCRVCVCVWPLVRLVSGWIFSHSCISSFRGQKRAVRQEKHTHTRRHQGRLSV